MNQTPNLTQVRQALKVLAERKGRPDYELCTAKEVKLALEHGLEHPLIKELPFFESEPKKVDKPLKAVVPREYPTPVQAKEIQIWLKNFVGKYIDLAQMIGCSPSILQHIKTGRTNCTLDMYRKITKARKQLEEVLV